MDPKLMAVIIVVAIVAVLVIVWAVARKQRSAKLRRRFGAEYDRTVRDTGPQRAETVLLERERRVERFTFRELGAEEREKFVTEWRVVQSRFVDDPRGAVRQADLLVDRLMLARGYPVADFEQRAADISVEHAGVVDNYRAAHQIALRHRQGQATTEDLRNAIIYYRSLFDELLQTDSIGRHKEVA
jgi:FtsZ-interacting cell division protein ZipA